MAKKKVIQDGIVEETVVVDEPEASVVPRDEDEGIMIEQLQPMTVSDVPLIDGPELNVKLTLPRGALIALIDPTHPEASEYWALHYGLLSAEGLTPIGEKVLAGCDQTAVHHQMATAWRTAYNAALEQKKA